MIFTLTHMYTDACIDTKVYIVSHSLSLQFACCSFALLRPLSLSLSLSLPLSLSLFPPLSLSISLSLSLDSGLAVHLPHVPGRAQVPHPQVGDASVRSDFHCARYLYLPCLCSTRISSSMLQKDTSRCQEIGQTALVSRLSGCRRLP